MPATCCGAAAGAPPRSTPWGRAKPVAHPKPMPRRRRRCGSRPWAFWPAHWGFDGLAGFGMLAHRRWRRAGLSLHQPKEFTMNKSTRLLSALLALSLASAGAFAQDRRGDDRRGD